MENEHRPQSHKEREAQTLVDRIEKKEAAHQAANEADREGGNEENVRRLQENSLMSDSTRAHLPLIGAV